MLAEFTPRQALGKGHKSLFSTVPVQGRRAASLPTVTHTSPSEHALREQPYIVTKHNISTILTSTFLFWEAGKVGILILALFRQYSM